MDKRTLTVRGTGTVSVSPDTVTLTLCLEAADTDYGRMTADAEQKLDALRRALVSAGHPESTVKTADFSVNAEYEGYTDEKGNWSNRFSGYKCIHTLKLEFDLDKALLSSTLSAIAESGTEPRIDVNFGVKDKDGVSDGLLHSAVKDASRRASVLADAAGVKLGEIKSIEYDFGGTHFLSETRLAYPQMAMKTDGISFEPRDIQVSDSVTVVWEIL